MEEEWLEEVRSKKLQKRLQEMQRAQALEAQMKSIALKTLEPGAYEKVMNARLANPELYNKFIRTLAYLMQTGQLRGKLSEEKAREILAELSQRTETKIVLKRKGIED